MDIRHKRAEKAGKTDPLIGTMELQRKKEGQRHMKGWNEGITNAIAYIEENLTDEIDINRIAEEAHVSSFYFQKIFSVLCGFTVGEYIRNRRLTLAAQELCSAHRKVIDIALKYGYDSPDSFARAFTKFHGISPSAAREQGKKLNSFAPLKIILSLEGGTMLEYKIVEKSQFTVIGKQRKFNTETSYNEIPKFWLEHMNSGDSKEVVGMYGICMDVDGKDFDYFIADNYIPWKEIPEGYVTKVIPAGVWAVFPCHGALPEALQEVNTKIWREWLPSCKAYQIAGNYSIEMYTPLCEKPEDNYTEIWIPVKKA